MDDAKLALFVRGAWTESTTTIHTGTLKPHFTEAGDFLLYTPLPFTEDYTTNIRSRNNVTFGYDAPPPRDISDIIY